MIAENIADSEHIVYDYYKYFTDLYGTKFKIKNNQGYCTSYDLEELKNKVCPDFLNALQSKIDCDAALEYIEKHSNDI